MESRVEPAPLVLVRHREGGHVLLVPGGAEPFRPCPAADTRRRPRSGSIAGVGRSSVFPGRHDSRRCGSRRHDRSVGGTAARRRAVCLDLVHGTDFFISSFVSTALPTGSADVIRACALSQSGVGGQAATASVVVDRILGVVSLLLLGLVSLASGIPEANLPPLARLVAGLCLVASVVVLFGALWTDRLAGVVLPQMLQRSAVGQWLLLTAGEIASYRSRRGVLIPPDAP